MISIRSKIISASTAMALLFMTSGLPETLAVPRSSSINIIPHVTSVSLGNNGLVAMGTVTATIHGQTTTVPFRDVPVDISLAPNQPPGALCPVLDLMLGPIHLNLLGLDVL